MRRMFVSGGHGGLAQAVVECFAAAGWNVDAPSRAVLDVGDRSAVRRWFDSRAAYDLAVCAAGIARDRPFLKQTEKEWDEVVRVNVTGSAWCARCAVAAMVREKREGQVVMVGSYAALRPAPSQAAYAASKSALGMPGRPVSSIFPVVMGGNDAALSAAGALLERGFLAPAIRYPTVPRGTARLRVTVTAAHQAAQIRQLGEALAELLCGE